MVWDLFISHVSEDKDAVARPLAEMFITAGLKVWYDEYSLTVGDSLRRSIDTGLGGSRYGLVILSPNFIQKEWAQKELDGLVARADGSEKRILPVWHNLTPEAVAAFSPTLADKLAVSTSHGLPHVVKEIMKVFEGCVETTGEIARQLDTTTKFVQPPTIIRPDRTWIMLGETFYLAESVRHQSNGQLEILVSPANGKEEAQLAALRPTQNGSKPTLPLAVGNDAHLVRVQQITTETTSGVQRWTFLLTETGSRSAHMIADVRANDVGPNEIARRRAGRILVNDPRPVENPRAVAADSLVENFIAGAGEYAINECVVRSIFREHGRSSEWTTFARLNAVFLLKITGTVEHIQELAIGRVKDGKVEIRFRGLRPQRFRNLPPVTIKIDGSCPLSE